MSPQVDQAAVPGAKHQALDLLYCARSLDAQLLSGEPDLNRTRWPGYSGSVASLNLQLATAYQEQYRDQIRAKVDYKMAPNTKGLDLAPFRSAFDVYDDLGDVYSIHLARQFADHHGLPYPRFLRFCFDFASSKERKQLPRPNQLIPRKVEKVALFMQMLDKLVEDELPLLLRSYHARNPDAQTQAIPSCRGVIGARDERSAVCVVCPIFKKCGTTIEKLEAVIRKIEIDSGKRYALADRKRDKENTRRSDKRAEKKKVKIQTQHLNSDAPFTM